MGDAMGGHSRAIRKEDVTPSAARGALAPAVLASQIRHLYRRFLGSRSLGSGFPDAIRLRSIGAVCLLMTTVACRHVATYRPDSLPEGLAAQPRLSAGQLDLAQLARHARHDPRLVPGDVLRVSVVAGPDVAIGSEAVSLRVNDDGTVAVPLVGPVPVAGRTISEAERAIRDAGVERGIYRSPQVAVVREQRKEYSIIVVGAVADPGVHRIPVGECHLLAAIVYAGGLTDDASTWVKVQSPNRGGGGERIDLRHPERVREVALSDGDVVRVERRGPESVYVMGLVARPQEIELMPGKSLRLLDAISTAGGRRLQIAQKVKVIRYPSDGTEPVVIETTIRDAKKDSQSNLVLAAGDVVSVEETPVTFAVELLQNFVRFGFSSAIPFF